MKNILLAGGTGVLGRGVHRELVSRGYRAHRILRRDAGPGDWIADLRHPPSLRGACDTIDAVISCAGARMNLNDWKDKAGFRQVDLEGNRNLLAEAVRARVRKFVYVSLANGPAMAQTEYARRHEEFVEELKSSGLDWSVVRPTGFFAFFGEILNMARRGTGIVPGNGQARTNPIHEADAARACVEALRPGPLDLPVGGPVIYTRLAITRAAFTALGKKAAIHHVPAWAFSPVPKLLKYFNPRIAALIEFGTAVSQVDCIAPVYGAETLEEYFRKLAGMPAARENGGSDVSGRSSAVSARS